ncbi:DUF2268 domain-containing putative Zn-dependent protease [Niallia sp. XMNu-256]|uniref:DUF2268 domain-containing protein n=1 Tax=Niallia sp. XMNu-256 TaxID=3082444 RepID=UPI0030D39E0F
MGIERTDIWLKENFNRPLKLLREKVLSNEQEDEKRLYNLLRSFGMYSPNRLTKRRLGQLNEQNFWSKAEKIFDSYQKKWQGPDIPIYIFPIHTSFSQELSGVSFNNKMFLFISPVEKLKRLEALIVHEYHHVCRLNKSSKLMIEYTLLDSVLMEGFAEWAVTKFCGEQYNAKWIHEYTDEQLERFYKRDIKHHLMAKRTERIHDVLLFGKGLYPELIGYSVGYWLVKKASEKHKFSIEETFTVTSEEIKKIIE